MDHSPSSSLKNTQKDIEQYDHLDKTRLNNPPVGLVTPKTDAPEATRTYAYDPHLDPQLIWAGKAERTSFDVPTVSLHVHERIDPLTIIDAVRKPSAQPEMVQGSLFDLPAENPPLHTAIEFYKHAHKWSNRLIAGDSLLVMSSLLEKEGMAGQVQMIYVDPPYGVKYGSNFQPFVNRRDVKDGKDEDLTQEPEMIRAFRDTWELGIHSYLSYLRDRLLLARELLAETGSCFVQISDENVHHVRSLMDEVLGAGNAMPTIVFRKTTGAGSPSGYVEAVPQTFDYILWYAKDRSQAKLRRIFLPRTVAEDYNLRWIETASGQRRRMTAEEIASPQTIPAGSRPFRPNPLTSQSGGPTTTFDVEFDGSTFQPGKGGWKTNTTGMENLHSARRLMSVGNTLCFVRYLDDFPYRPIIDIWDDTRTSGFSDPKIYVVQTNPKVIARCLLMTTDPGDLVFDPTCVRKGTKVYGPTPALPVDGEGRRPVPAGGDESHVPPSTGGLQGGRSSSTCSLRAIESIQPGELVYAHDGRAHRVLRVMRKRYRGPMIGIRQARAANTLWLTADHRVLAKTRPRTLGGTRDWSAIPAGRLERTRELRRDASPAERRLWNAVRGGRLGVKFRRQHPVGTYVADFYSRDAHLVVEVDGSTHFEPEAMAYDGERNAFMRSLGLDVLRFTTRDVDENLDGVCLAIERQCRLRAESVDGAAWVQAGSLEPGDLVFVGPGLEAVPIDSIDRALTDEEVYDLEVEGAHSFLTEACAVHNCGSGTTAYVAEQWGRRWISCDTSRVAVTLAKQRLMTARFDYYDLARPDEGIGSGFKYKTVPHVTLKSIANNEPPTPETLYDQPFVDNKRARVTGPFTLEAVPAPVVKPVTEVGAESPPADASIARDGATLRHAEWREELLKTGIRGKSGETITFSRVEPLGGTRYLHADAETKEDLPKRVVISFGPEHAPLEQRQVELALEEAHRLYPRPTLLLFAAFQFDPEAAKDVAELTPENVGITLLTVLMNTDLLTDDLKKKRSNNESFWLIGQPDVEVRRLSDGPDQGKYQVEVHGFDYYNPRTGAIESGDTSKIAIWLLDPDYDGRSLFPRQVFFPMAGPNDGWARLAKSLRAEIDEERIEAYRGTVSLPFPIGARRRVGVKIVDDRGIESLKIVEVG